MQSSTTVQQYINDFVAYALENIHSNAEMDIFIQALERQLAMHHGEVRDALNEIGIRVSTGSVYRESIRRLRRLSPTLN